MMGMGNIGSKGSVYLCVSVTVCMCLLCVCVCVK